MGELGDDELLEALMVKQNAKRLDLLQARQNLMVEEEDLKTKKEYPKMRPQFLCALVVWVVGNSSWNGEKLRV